MKIYVGSFTTESNEKAPYKTQIQNYDLIQGDELLSVLGVKDIFEEENVEAISGYYANANAASIVEEDTFCYIEKKIIEGIKNHIHELDGIYLHLHGASYVENIGSGDHHILKEIRKIVGPYLPIAVSCDPHGNLTKEYVESLQIIRSYRESPHVDATETKNHTIKLLIDLIRHHEKIHAVYRKLPLILGGEQSVSADEPVRSINDYMNQLEEDEKIMSVSWHVGYLRHDCPEAGCGIVVVPTKEKYQKYAEKIADDLKSYVWNKRYEFHYTGKTAEPEVALQMALECDKKTFVLTDSGDNTTSGSTGWNTFVLRQFLAVKNLKKNILFGSIKDEYTYKQLDKININASRMIHLGMNKDELSKSVVLNVKKLKKADIILVHGEKVIGTLGQGILVHVIGTGIDIIVTNRTARMTNTLNFEEFDINWTDYDVVVLKQGYIFPDFKAKACDYVMSLTDGDTPQNTKKIPFKLIMSPMFPIDEM